MRGGIDLGGTKIQTVVVDAANSVLGQARRPTPQSGGPIAIATAMAESLGESAGQAGIGIDSLEGVGVGSPGDVDSHAGAVSGARNLSGWTGTFALAAVLQEQLGTRVELGNDVSVAVDAEAELGAGRGRGSMLGVFWGTGVGGGIVLDGKSWVGRGAAAEIGHVVVKRGGRRCPCGRKGCMEAYAGRAALEARARKLADRGESTQLFRIMEKRGRDRLTSGIWARALDHGDGLATKLLDEAVEALGTGIASSVNLLDPEVVIIGGGLGLRLGEPYRQRILEAMMPHLFVDSDPPDVVLAELGDLGGAVGAALLARSAAEAS